MKRVLLCLSMLALVAACGADGVPFRPTASAGISIGTGGVSTDCSIGTTNGTVSVKVGC